MAITADTTNVETVLLRGGLAVPLEALRLLWRLEETRGTHVPVDGLTSVVTNA
jgi:hypothetical protein